MGVAPKRQVPALGHGSRPARRHGHGAGVLDQDRRAAQVGPGTEVGAAVDRGVVPVTAIVGRLQTAFDKCPAH